MLRLLEYRVGSSDVVGDWAGEDTAGDVGAVPLVFAAKVEQHDLVWLHNPLGGVVMRRSRIRSRSNDAELDLLVTSSEHPARHIGLDFEFGASDKRNVTPLNLGSNTVRQPTNGLQRLHLTIALYRTKPTEAVAE